MVERIAQWWTQASQESRFLYLLRAIEGQTETTLQELQLAILLAESEAGEKEERDI